MTDVIEDVGTMTATWTDPTGTVWQLSDTDPDGQGWFTINGPSGWHATTYEIVTDPLPRGGEQVRAIRSKPAEINWPVYVGGESHEQYVQRSRQLRRAMLMTLHRGQTGILRVTRPGTLGSREIDAFYRSGLEGEAGEGWLYSKDTVTLFCPDGYWRDTTPLSVTYAYTPGLDFFDPFPQVSPGLSFGETEMDNPGDVDAWPDWVITGPMTALTATNVTTGLEFSVTYGLNAGEQITIATKQPQVRGPAGQNLTDALNWPAAYLWYLVPGTNAMVLNVSGGAEGTTVDISYHPRYDGA